MKRQWIGVFVAVGFATTAVLGAQDKPSPANVPPADAAAPPGIQKPALPAPVGAAEGKHRHDQRLHPRHPDGDGERGEIR